VFERSRGSEDNPFRFSKTRLMMNSSQASRWRWQMSSGTGYGASEPPAAKSKASLKPAVGKRCCSNQMDAPVLCKSRRAYGTCSPGLPRSRVRSRWRMTPMAMEDPCILLAILAAIFRSSTSAALCKLSCELLPLAAGIVCALADSASRIILSA
jgi:hypothetical protein